MFVYSAKDISVSEVSLIIIMEYVVYIPKIDDASFPLLYTSSVVYMIKQNKTKIKHK